MELNAQQTEAMDKIINWYQDGGGQPFRLFGFAGTGKTTLAAQLTEALGAKPVFGTYTGKAASVLRAKGVNAGTIHSSIYRPVGNSETKRQLEAAQGELYDLEHDEMLDDETRDQEISQKQDLISQLEREMKTVGFVLNDMSEWTFADLIVLDEVSMVNERVGRDIESFGVPILVLGDPAQLPPVDGGGYFTQAEPDAMLTEVMRTAGDSPVLDLATRIRSTTRGNGLTDADIRTVDLDEAMAADQVLVWKNATRWGLTSAIRAALGRPAGRVVIGDRVMCLTNNKDIGILNGEQFMVVEVDAAPGQPGPRLLLQEIDSDRPPRWIKAYADGFMNLGAEQAMKRNFGAYRGDRGAFTFANVVTVHKAQGSEWGSVYVVDQSDGVVAMARKEMSGAEAVAMGRRWIYTAVTRAQESVVIARR